MREVEIDIGIHAFGVVAGDAEQFVDQNWTIWPVGNPGGQSSDLPKYFAARRH